MCDSRAETRARAEREADETRERGCARTWRKRATSRVESAWHGRGARPDARRLKHGHQPVSRERKARKKRAKKYLNKKTFPYSNKINFNSLRKGEIIGEHEVKFSSGKEIITLNHEAFDRALYSEGALMAAKWLMNKKPGLYSMRDLMNFK